MEEFPNYRREFEPTAFRQEVVQSVASVNFLSSAPSGFNSQTIDSISETLKDSPGERILSDDTHSDLPRLHDSGLWSNSGPTTGPLPLEKRTHVDNPQAVEVLANFLRREFSRTTSNTEILEVLCIGTDRSTGDSLGPLVGTILEEWQPSNICVRGTLENPVHATNLTQTLAGLNALKPPPLIIAIDACLGRLDNVGTITAGRGPLRPGAGVNKSLPPAGELHIVGTVNVGGFMEYFVLQNTRLNLVLRMARIIASAVRDAWDVSIQTKAASSI